MKYCSKCGNELASDSKFCSNCGFTLDKSEETEVTSNSIDDTTIESASKQYNQKPDKKKRKFKILILLVLLIATSGGLYYFFFMPDKEIEAEKATITWETVTGYWVKDSSDGTQSDDLKDNDLTMSLYLDKENMIIAEKNEEKEVVEIFSIVSSTFDKEKVVLKVESEDNKEEQTFELISVGPKQISLDTGESTIMLSAISKEDYLDAGGIELESYIKDTDSKLENEDEKAVEEKTDDLTVSEVSGYYVRRDDSGHIIEVYTLNDEFTSHVIFRPDNYYPVAYASNKIENKTIEGNTVHFETISVDHQSLKEGFTVESTIDLSFDKEAQPVTMKLNESKNVFEKMKLDVVQTELDSLTDIDIEKFLTELYENDLTGLLMKEKVNNLISLDKDVQIEDIWGTYLEEADDAEGYPYRSYIKIEPIEEVTDFIDEVNSYTIDDLKQKEILGLLTNWSESDNPMSEMGGVISPSYITNIEIYDQNYVEIEYVYQLGVDPVSEHFELKKGSTKILKDTDNREYILE